MNVESDSIVLGRNALRMLIANSKDTLRFDMRLTVPFQEPENQKD